MEWARAAAGLRGRDGVSRSSRHATPHGIGPGRWFRGDDGAAVRTIRARRLGFAWGRERNGRVSRLRCGASAKGGSRVVRVPEVSVRDLFLLLWGPPEDWPAPEALASPGLAPLRRFPREAALWVHYPAAVGVLRRCPSR